MTSIDKLDSVFIQNSFCRPRRKETRSILVRQKNGTRSVINLFLPPSAFTMFIIVLNASLLPLLSALGRKLRFQLLTLRKIGQGVYELCSDIQNKQTNITTSYIKDMMEFGREISQNPAPLQLKQFLKYTRKQIQKIIQIFQNQEQRSQFAHQVMQIAQKVIKSKTKSKLSDPLCNMQ